MGFGLSLEGSPRVFTTGNHAFVASTHPLWPKGAAILSGYLQWPDFDIEETVNPIDGDISVSGATFLVEDKPLAVLGGTIPPYTYWCARDAQEIDSASLDTDTATLTATSALVVVQDAGSFVTGPQVVWVDREAIACDSFDSGALEFTVTGSTAGRGWYGSQARSHRSDPYSASSPLVFAEYFELEGRLAVLWHIADDGTVEPLWIGIVREPRLSDDGARWSLQSEHVWTIIKETPLGEPYATTTLYGFDVRAMKFLLRRDGDSRIYESFVTDDGSLSTYRDSLLEACSEHVSVGNGSIVAQLVQSGNSGEIFPEIQQTGASGLKFVASGSSTSVMSAEVVMGNDRGSATSVNNGGSYTFLTLDLTSPEAILSFYRNRPTWYPVSTLAELPTASVFQTPSRYTDSTITTTVQAQLRGPLDATRNAVLEVADIDDSGTQGLRVLAYAKFTPSTPGGALPPAYVVLSNAALRLQLTTVVSTGHWFYGLKRALVGSPGTVLSGYLDERFFDFTTTADRTVGLTLNRFAARDWFFDGSKTFIGLMQEIMPTAGCALGIRHGVFCPFALQPPLPTDTSVATFNSASNHVYKTKPRWSRAASLHANRLRISGQNLQVDVNSVGSIDRYGPRRRIEVSLAGVRNESALTGNPVALAAEVGGRTTALWEHPVAMIEFDASLENARSVFVGDIVTYTDYLSPNAQGDRGISAKKVQVVSRKISPKKGAQGMMTFRVLDYRKERLAGWAPAAKVASISGAVLTLDRGYAAGGDYANAGTSSTGDGGASKFVAGDRVRLILRDSTTLTTYSGVVLSVNTGAHTITLTASVSTSPNNWPTLCAGWVDVEYDDYTTSGLQTAQKDYAYLASFPPASVIAGTADTANRFSP